MLPDDYELPLYEGPTVRFVVRYRADREDDALLLARRLFAELDQRIEALTLTPVEGDQFDVWLDGELVHSRRASGEEPSALRLAELAWTHLGGRERDAGIRTTPDR
ncbi:MAG TPA: Rdx family protein [Chloroflexota bacterium]|jgi:predicted Rdx family selenoprotein|nr:Rdx family protein [Chloroflexota bacterium]